MSRLIQDSRYAFRAFLRGRFVTVLAVLAFALGIGVTTAVFSIFAGILLTPLPYPNGHELVIVYDTQPALATAPASFPKYHDWKERNSVFAAIGGSSPASFVMTGNGEPELVAGIATTASLADVLDVRPAARVLLPARAAGRGSDGGAERYLTSLGSDLDFRIE